MTKFQPFKVTEEMQKLRDYLDAHNIRWRDKSEKSANCQYWMCRTHFNLKGFRWSVIHGYGSYGGPSPYNIDTGTLELMTNALNGGEPLGYLSADNVIECIEKELSE